MLLFFCLAIFLDFAKLAAAEEAKDPDVPGMVTILYHAFFLAYIMLKSIIVQIEKINCETIGIV